MIKTIPIRLDYYQSATETWRKILGKLNFRKLKTVIDLCPGWSPKLELALLETDFSGILYAVDKSKDNLNILKSLIGPFPKKFIVRYMHADILNLSKVFTNLSADLILANHIVDDMLLDNHLKGNRSNIELFENPVLLRKTWLEISDFTGIKDGLKRILASKLNPGGYLLLAQYLGYQENLYKLWGAYKKCKGVVDSLKTDLLKTGEFVEEKGIITSAFLEIKNPYFPKDDILCLRKLV